MRYKSIDDQLIGIDDKFQNIWANGEISIENQLKDLLKNNNQEIFTVSHKMDEATPSTSIRSTKSCMFIKGQS